MNGPGFVTFLFFCEIQVSGSEKKGDEKKFEASSPFVVLYLVI